jgi:hypothetical protein
MSVRLLPAPITVLAGPEALALPDVQGEMPRERKKRPPIAAPRDDATSVASTPRPKASAPAALLPDVSDPNYYTAREVDVYPVLIAPRDWQALIANRVAWRSGEGLFKLRIDEVGRVAKLVILEPDSLGTAEESLRAAFSAAVFSAARKDGRPVKSEIVVRLNLRRASEPDRPEAPTVTE